jgi:branched-subunit amino acid transport protein
VSTAAIVVAGCTVATFAIKGVGPVLSGGRELPRAVRDILVLLAPALLAALVAIQLTGGNGVVRLDVKLPSVILAALLASLRVPLIICVVAGAALAALLRAAFHFG